MTESVLPETHPPLNFRESLGAIAYVGFGSVYLHAFGLWVAHQIAGNPQDTWRAYLGAGGSMIQDMGWVIPTAVASIVGAYLALFGETVFNRKFGRATKDFAILACLGIASMMLGYSTTTSIALVSDGDDASRALPLVGFTAFAVLLAARAGTAFWGSPTRQLRAATSDLAEMRVMQRRLRPPVTTTISRAIALLAWTTIPLIVLYYSIPSTLNTPAALTLARTAAAFEFVFLNCGLTYFVRYRAISRKPFNQSLNVVGLILTVLSSVVFSIPLWIFLDNYGRLEFAILLAIVVAATLAPVARFVPASIASDLAYLRLAKRIPKAEAQIEHARARVRLDSTLSQ